ncbi:MAG: SLOG cluster 4 domain-containing protein [Gammaproteobacteria bacterium]
MKRRIIIGVIGGDRQEQAAREFGCAVTRAGCFLLTGGGQTASKEVKDASIVGAKNAAQESGLLARFVGILPSDTYRWEQNTSSLLLYTGLKHNLRNVINGVTPDVIVVFGGSRGTLAEAAFAAAAGKKLFFFSGQNGGGVDRLRRNFEDHFNDHNCEHQSDIDIYLSKPLNYFPNAWTRTPTRDGLLALIKEMLRVAEDWKGSVDELVHACISAVPDKDSLGSTGFPGLPNDPKAKDRFESEIIRISNAL